MKRKNILEWYKNRSEVQKYVVYFCVFTVIFVMIFCGINFNLISKRKSLIINNDSLATYYEILMYRKRLLIEFWNNLIINHRFEIPWINYNLSTDRNLGCVISHEIFDVFLWFVPRKYHEVSYCLVIVARIWLSGVSFSVYCFYMGYRKYSTIIAAFIYVFNGYGLLFSFSQPVFTAMLYLTPLLLIGLEKILRGKSGIFFAVMTAISAFVNIVFLYYITIGGIIYFILRVVFYNGNYKERFRLIIKTILYYIIGISMSGVVSFPTIYGIIMSSRISETTTVGKFWIYSISQYIRYLWNFFMLKADIYTGYSIIAFYPLVYVFLSKKHKFYKWWIGMIILLMNIPIFQLIAGMSAPSDRWTFCLGLSIAIIFARVLPELLTITMSKRLVIGINIIAFLYLLYLAVLFQKSRNIPTLITCVWICIMGVFFNYIWKKKTSYKVIFFLILLEAVIFSANGFMVETDNYVDRFVDLGKANIELDSYPDILAWELEDDTFWRADKEKFEGEVSCNLPYYYGYNGISSFYTLNPDAISYFSMTGNPGLLQSNKMSDMNSRITDETLACVKYLFVLRDEIARIPYGFKFLKESEKNVAYDIYINENVMPLGYTYDECISEELFENMNIAEQQEILLKNAVIKDGSTKSPALQSKELDNYGILLSGVQYSSGKYKVIEQDARIELTIQAHENQEIYISLADMQNSGSGICQINVAYNGNEDAGYLYSDKIERSNRIKTFNFNVGTYDVEEEIKVTITFSADAVDIGGIHVYERSLESYMEDIDRLQKDSLDNIRMGVNGFEGDISTGEKILCFSIPYSKGWSCYVDGQKADLLKVNLMYSAVELQKGSHHIVMKYTPPFLITGIVAGALGILLLLIISLQKNG